MKNITIALGLFFSLTSFAHVEHKKGMGEAPSASRLGLAHQCFQEAMTAGCRNPRENREEFRACVRDQHGSFSSGCQTFLSRLYGKN